MNYLLSVFIVVFFVNFSSEHGMMLSPVARGSRWRFNNSAPKDYDDNAGFCGGFGVQYFKNHGKCGLCGDDYSKPLPRSHELGGKYGEGVIVQSYKTGSKIQIEVRITANHKGYFKFHLCDLTENRNKESERCFKKYPLKVFNSEDEYRYYLPSTNIGMFEPIVELPDVICDHCVLRWTYTAGNNWGICPNGTAAIGCGPQEHFVGCADIALLNINRGANYGFYEFIVGVILV
ncbi:hypothetical protein ACFFRR_000767 [Megaselia abdita]